MFERRKIENLSANALAQVKHWQPKNGEEISATQDISRSTTRSDRTRHDTTQHKENVLCIIFQYIFAPSFVPAFFSFNLAYRFLTSCMCVNVRLCHLNSRFLIYCPMNGRMETNDFISARRGNDHSTFVVPTQKSQKRNKIQLRILISLCVLIIG